MQPIDTWAKIQNEEDIMNDHYAPFWRAMITQMTEADLHNASVPDFGCNQGGVLRTLFRIRPVKRGLGVDLAVKNLWKKRTA